MQSSLKQESLSQLCGCWGPKVSLDAERSWQVAGCPWSLRLEKSTLQEGHKLPGPRRGSPFSEECKSVVSNSRFNTFLNGE